MDTPDRYKPDKYNNVPTSDHTIGWIVLTVFLTIGVLIFMFLWVANGITFTPCSPTGAIFFDFGVTAGVDANALTSCGTNGITPCVFAMNNLADCINQCNILSAQCSAFSFNPTSNTMKIVVPNNTFVSSNVDLYARQPLTT